MIITRVEQSINVLHILGIRKFKDQFTREGVKLGMDLDILSCILHCWIMYFGLDIVVSTSFLDQIQIGYISTYSVMIHRTS
jgi:hypothetical protein